MIEAYFLSRANQPQTVVLNLEPTVTRRLGFFLLAANIYFIFVDSLLTLQGCLTVMCL